MAMPAMAQGPVGRISEASGPVSLRPPGGGWGAVARGAALLVILPRMRIPHTAEGQSGQIYIPSVAWLLLAGVLWLVNSFRSSGALASAYGISVTGTMVLTTVLGVLYLIRSGRMRAPAALALALPVAAIEWVFLASNLSKVDDGGYVPLIVASVVGLVMAAWWRGAQAVRVRVHKLAVPRYWLQLKRQARASIFSSARWS